MTQTQLGNALQTLGMRENGSARLEEAIVAYRAALEEQTRERAPIQWAATQGNPATCCSFSVTARAARNGWRRQSSPTARHWTYGPAIAYRSNGRAHRTTSQPRFARSGSGRLARNGWRKP